MQPQFAFMMLRVMFPTFPKCLLLFGSFTDAGAHCGVGDGGVGGGVGVH